MKQFYFLFITALIATASFAQSTEDTTDGRFHDDLLNHLVGEWNVTAIAHGFPTTSVINVKWILSHQLLEFHLTGNDTIPWIGMPMEFEYFIGYNHPGKRYIIHGVSVFGYDEDEGFWYAYRNGNEIKIYQTANITAHSDTLNIQTLTWEPASNSWHIQSRPQIAGKEGEVFLDMKLTAVKPSSK